MAENTTVIAPENFKIELLRHSEYFKGLIPAHLAIIEEMAFPERYERDDIILSEGDPNRKLYFIAEGAVKVFGTSTDGKEQIIALARPGESFNDVAAFDSGLSQASVQALSPVVLYAVDGYVLLDQSCRLGDLAANITRFLASRVRQLGGLVADLSFRPVIGRLAKILLEQLDNGQIPYLTQRDMAAMVGTAREVVARALKSLEGEGVIIIEKHRIVIKDRQALEELAP